MTNRIASPADLTRTLQTYRGEWLVVRYWVLPQGRFWRVATDLGMTGRRVALLPGQYPSRQAALDRLERGL